jgi:hypothetical protein
MARLKVRIKMPTFVEGVPKPERPRPVRIPKARYAWTKQTIEIK